MDIFRIQFVYDLFTKVWAAYLIFAVHLRDDICKKFTKNLPKFVYVVYEAFPKIWLQFVYYWFTLSLQNNFGVHLPTFIYQNLVNEQPWRIDVF